MSPLHWDDFLKLRKELPVVDARSPAEFLRGHIRQAVNIPLLNDEERAVVGTAYKRNGRQEAVRQGFRLVGPRLVHIIEATEQIAENNAVIAHCWRGGMRSANYARFVEMAGIEAHTLEGGYKTYRQNALASFQLPLHLILLTGFTGSGKSEILREMKRQGEQVIDLESLACHKGSAFGAIHMPAQPTTEQFQNDLFEEILKLDPARPVWIEDESIAIGKIFLPEDFWKRMTQSALVRVDVDRAIRSARLAGEYQTADPGIFLASLQNIAKKLGGLAAQTAANLVREGRWQQAIEIILTYYDKAYQASMEKRKDRIAATIRWDGADAASAARELSGIVNRQPQMIQHG